MPAPAARSDSFQAYSNCAVSIVRGSKSAISAGCTRRVRTESNRNADEVGPQPAASILRQRTPPINGGQRVGRAVNFHDGDVLLAEETNHLPHELRYEQRRSQLVTYALSTSGRSDFSPALNPSSGPRPSRS